MALITAHSWAGDVLKVIDELGEVPDLIVLDPPRDGVNPKALIKILNFGVDRSLYICLQADQSCQRSGDDAGQRI